MPVPNIFDPVPQVPASQDYKKVIAFTAKRKPNAAPSGTYKLRLKRGVLDTCGGYDDGGSVWLWIP